MGYVPWKKIPSLIACLSGDIDLLSKPPVEQNSKKLAIFWDFLAWFDMIRAQKFANIPAVNSVHSVDSKLPHTSYWVYFIKILQKKNIENPI